MGFVNLNHLDDNRLLELPAFRQKVAEAYVAGLLEYYGGGADFRRPGR